ncbi:MAG: SDR family oxidoreductase [Candidatus Accumulibacter sp.]|jgi:NAD(P)-dependent dehydrogenase (short-subunit alcohol dehydrogenase family)|nr:SDR family oxidoreductase [Accumulibacter sp.]
MELELQDKHVLIGGGSKGIGLACAQGFLREGARVSLVSRAPENLESARESLLAGFSDARERVATFAADLRDADAAAAAAADAENRQGPVDVLVNCAGAARRMPPDELTPAHWREAMEAKYFTYIHLIDPVVKRMAARGAGVILNVIGMGGKTARKTHLPGGAANAALMLATAGLAAAYGPRGVRVNAVNPGQTLTQRLQEGLLAEARMNGCTPEEALARACSELPLGRIATPEEIADAVVFLCSARASYVSGAILAMDGALTPTVV